MLFSNLIFIFKIFSFVFISCLLILLQESMTFCLRFEKSIVQKRSLSSFSSKVSSSDFQFYSTDHADYQSFLQTLPKSKSLVYLDTETTGIYPQDRIIEIAIIKRNYLTFKETSFHTMINPQGRRIHPFAKEKTGISEKDLIHAPLFTSVVNDILHIIGDDLIVAHNAPFDRRFLNSELLLAKKTAIADDNFECSLRLATSFFGKAKNRNTLENISQNYNIILSDDHQYHRALGDTLVLAEFFPKLKIQLFHRDVNNSKQSIKIN